MFDSEHNSRTAFFDCFTGAKSKAFPGQRTPAGISFLGSPGAPGGHLHCGLHSEHRAFGGPELEASDKSNNSNHTTTTTTNNTTTATTTTTTNNNKSDNDTNNKSNNDDNNDTTTTTNNNNNTQAVRAVAFAGDVPASAGAVDRGATREY